jgi:hypothetical protein
MSQRRESVLGLVAEGKTTTQISKILGISRATVRYYREDSKAKQAERTSEHRRRLKRKGIDYSGGRCLRPECGYNRCDGALDFHHVDQTQKDARIANGKTSSWKRVKPEIDKTILLCKVCHTELHAGMWEVDESLFAKQIEIRGAYVDRPLADYADTKTLLYGVMVAQRSLEAFA